MAGTVAIRMQQNSFRRKLEDYVRPDPQNADRRRKGYTAVAAKMASVAYAVVTTGIDYRPCTEMQPVASVTKKGCDLLVASDLSSQSGKAHKARRYGIPVMDVIAFLDQIE